MNARLTTENIGLSMNKQQKVKIDVEIAFICSFVFHLSLNRIRATSVSAFQHGLDFLALFSPSTQFRIFLQRMDCWNGNVSTLKFMVILWYFQKIV